MISKSTGDPLDGPPRSGDPMVLFSDNRVLYPPVMPLAEEEEVCHSKSNVSAKPWPISMPVFAPVLIWREEVDDGEVPVGVARF
jgi:hypothetical protein